MTYFKDMSPYSYASTPDRHSNVVNVGWLDGRHDYERAPPNENIIDILWKYCGVLINKTRGFHQCPICRKEEPIIDTKFGVKRLHGSAEIRVFGRNDIIFAAPDLIFHYVSVHQYKPPDAFTAALHEAAGPPSNEYFNQLRKNGYEWSEPLPSDGASRPFRFVKTADGVKKIFE